MKADRSIVLMLSNYDLAQASQRNGPVSDIQEWAFCGTPTVQKTGPEKQQEELKPLSSSSGELCPSLFTRQSVSGT